MGGTSSVYALTNYSSPMSDTIAVRRPASARPRPPAAAPVEAAKVAPEEDDGIADDNETW